MYFFSTQVATGLIKHKKSIQTLKNPSSTDDEKIVALTTLNKAFQTIGNLKMSVDKQRMVRLVRDLMITTTNKELKIKCIHLLRVFYKKGLKSLVLDEEVVLKIALQKTDQILDDELVEWLNEFCDKKLVDDSDASKIVVNLKSFKNRIKTSTRVCSHVFKSLNCFWQLCLLVGEDEYVACYLYCLTPTKQLDNTLVKVVLPNQKYHFSTVTQFEKSFADGQNRVGNEKFYKMYELLNMCQENGYLTLNVQISEKEDLLGASRYAYDPHKSYGSLFGGVSSILSQKKVEDQTVEKPEEKEELSIQPQLQTVPEIEEPQKDIQLSDMVRNEFKSWSSSDNTWNDIQIPSTVQHFGDINENKSVGFWDGIKSTQDTNISSDAFQFDNSFTVEKASTAEKTSFPTILEKPKIQPTTQKPSTEEKKKKLDYIPEHWGKAKIYKYKQSKDEPYFPEKFTIVQHDVFMCMDIKSNHNKYYSLELHSAVENNKTYYRIFTHYGRADDLDKNPDSGRKETRHFDSADEALHMFNLIAKDKTSEQKGYKKVQMASLNVGSEEARRQRLATTVTPAAAGMVDSKQVKLESKLHPQVQELVNNLYEEATSTLTSAIAGTITDKGIETPLGVLTFSQVRNGEKILFQIYEAIQKNEPLDKLMQLSGEFYSAIPHKFGGRAKQFLESAVIKDMHMVEQKQELLQLMQDMLQVNEEGKVLHGAMVDMKYKALKCHISYLDHQDLEFQRLKDFVLSSQVKSKEIKIRNIYSIKRDVELSKFRHDIPNKRHLFHGSRFSNFLGLLSRGLLMPHIVVGRGGSRTNAGWLGSGLYFGDAACTSAQYTTTSKNRTRLMLIVNVALGQMKEYTKITYDLTEPPQGYQSCHGVRRRPGVESDFNDDEYVIYDPNQQHLAYLVEFTLDSDAGKDLDELRFVTPFSKLNFQDKKEVEKPTVEKKVEFDLGTVEKPVMFKFGDIEQTNEFNPFSNDDKSYHKFSWGDGAVVKEKKLEVTVPEKIPLLVEKTPLVEEKTPLLEEKKPLIIEEEEKPKELEEKKAEEKPQEKPAEKFVFKIDKKQYDLTIGTREFTMDEMKKVENHYRDLFANNRTHIEISNPFVYLIDVFDNPKLFEYQDENEEEIKIPKVLTKFRKLGRKGSSVVSKEEFFKRWDEFTKGMLNGLDWNNIFIAGGSVLGNLLTDNSSGFSSCDIDMFFYDLTEEEANKKLRHVYEVISKNTNSQDVIRTKHAVTILGQYPFRHVQIVLRLYKSPAEVLIGFDIDSCTVGFDGQNVWATPRARRAINKGFNLVDMSRRSLTYEVRLFKYAKRGFAVAVPGLDRSCIDPEVFTKSAKEVEGLAKLLLFEYCVNRGIPPYSYKHSSQRKLARYLPKPHDQDNADKMAEYEVLTKLDPSDYSNIVIPWGPQWYNWQIHRMLKFHDKAQYYSKKNTHVFLSGIDEVINGPKQEKYPKKTTKKSPAKKSPDKKDVKKPDWRFINDDLKKPLSWLTENPGRQLLTGSFHPVDDEHWDANVYVTKEQEYCQNLCHAAFCGDRDAIIMLERQKVDVNGYDHFLGRSPLTYAVLYSQISAVEQLLEKKASVNIPDKYSSWYPIHYAAYTGNTKIMNLLLKAGADVNQKEEEHLLTPLHIAAYYGHANCIRVLLENGAQADAKDEWDRFPLHIAALCNQVECVKELMKAKPKLSTKKTAYSETAVESAVRVSMECIAALMSEQATLEEEQETSEEEDGEASWFEAAKTGKIKILKQLISEKADINQTDEAKVTALHIASKNDHPEIVKLLIENKADLNAKDILRQTPLHYAAKSGSEKCVQLLLDAGANPNIANIFGQSPLYYCLDQFGKLTGHSNEILFEYPSITRFKKLRNIWDMLIKFHAEYPKVAPIIASSNFSMPPVPDSQYLLPIFDAPDTPSKPFGFTPSKPKKPSKAENIKLKAKKLESKVPSVFGGLSSKIQSGLLSTPLKSPLARVLMLCAILYKGGQITAEQKKKLKKMAISDPDSQLYRELETYERDYDIGRLIDAFGELCDDEEDDEEGGGFKFTAEENYEDHEKGGGFKFTTEDDGGENDDEEENYDEEENFDEEENYEEEGGFKFSL